MKPIHVLGITLATAFGILWCVQIWSAGRWNTELQGDGKGLFYEQKQTNADVEAFAQEAFNDGPVPVRTAAAVSRSSGRNWLQKVIDRWVHGNKSAGYPNRQLDTTHLRQSHPAPPGVYFLLTRQSVRTRFGITGFSAGTRVVCVKDQGPVLLVKAGDLEFQAQRQYLTNDLDIAELAVRDDAEAQRVIVSYIAQQQQAIDRRDDTRNTRPSGQH
jgi:hypothetical protein